MSIPASFSNAEEMNGNEIARRTVGKYSYVLLASEVCGWRRRAYEVEFQRALIHLADEQFDNENKRNQSAEPGHGYECEWNL